MLKNVQGNIALGFCGSMGAGKSTLISKLKERWVEVDVISFGGYIRHQAELLGLEPERKNLQNLGQSLYEQHGPELFVNHVLQWAQPETKIHLFDGVRHIQVWDAICQRHERNVLIFLDLSSELQQTRLHNRESVEASHVFQSNFHPVEGEQDFLGHCANLRLNAASAVDDLIVLIDAHLANV